MNRAVSSSFWAVSRCLWASAGITSPSALLTLRPSSPAISIRRSVSLVTLSSLPKPHPQLTVLNRRPERAAGCQHPGERDIAAIVAHGHEQLTVLTGQRNVLPVGEGHLERQDVLGADLLDALRGTLVVAVRRVPVAVDRLGHAQQHSLADDLLVEQT